MTDIRHFVSTYIVDDNKFSADGAEDHQRAMEAHRARMEAKRQDQEAMQMRIELARIEKEKLEAQQQLEERLKQESKSELGIIEQLRARGHPNANAVADVLEELLPRMFDEAGNVKTSGASDHKVATEAVTDEKVATEAVTNQTVELTTEIPVSASSMALTPLPRDASAAVSDLTPIELINEPVKRPAKPAILLRDAMRRHLIDEEGNCTAQTIAHKKTTFSEFLECFGENVALNSFTRTEVADLWHPEEKARLNKKDLASLATNTDRSRSTDFKIRKLSKISLEKRRSYLRKFFDWAIECRIFKGENPMGQVMHKKSAIRAETKSYVPFSSEDIRSLFGEKYPQAMSKPEWYWAPLVALYSGARQGEICALEVKNFEIVDGIHVLFITEGKTDSSRRTVPIHSKLLELGLWEYVQALKRRGCKMIFPHAPIDYQTKSLGRKWGKWVDECGINNDRKTFHSFRSTVITAMHNASVDPAGYWAIRRAVGHTAGDDEGAHGGYVQGLALAKIQNAVESVRHDGFDVTHLRLADPTFTEFFDRYFAALPAMEANKQAKKLRAK